ncbi:class I SAM-dependent methyltransferase [Sorangium sp. So ce363]|uniref:class I SAM-dependent methyltransferase n=1 Tax=Sorangium sp. So ce363 TaxID=3133304 RepID=UPI003F5FF25A
MHLQAEQGSLNHQAWQTFCELVRQGAGVSDAAQADSSGVPPPSPADAAYLTDLVNHHRTNIVPFLVERCGIVGKSILEFGSGTGGLSIAMIEAGAAAVTGVEPNRLNCEASNWRRRAHGMADRVRFRYVPDTSHLPFPDDSIDMCVCNSVLQYVPDRRLRRTLLTEMYRVVKPGGILIVSGSGNGVFPCGPHTSRWWSNLAPDRAARLGDNRGVTYWEVQRALAPLGASLLPPAGRDDHALARWRRRLGTRGITGPRAGAYQLVFAAYSLCEATLCRWLDAPIEAFMPYVELAFRKHPPRGARATCSR